MLAPRAAAVEEPFAPQLLPEAEAVLDGRRVTGKASASSIHEAQGSRYFLGQRFCVLYFEICIPSLFSPSPLWSANFKTKHAQNFSPNK